MSFILNVGRDKSVLEARAEVLRLAGYAVISTLDDEHALAVAHDAQAIILGTTLPSAEKCALAERLRKVTTAPLICLDGHPYDCVGIGDVVLHSLDGPTKLLAALEKLVPIRQNH